MLSFRQTITSDIMLPETYWELKVDVNGYKNSMDDSELSTQANAGRKFEILKSTEKEVFNLAIPKIKVRLLEDGYICWLKKKDLENNAVLLNSWKPRLLTKEEIKIRIPNVLKWIEEASKINNSYLWGGTIGPNFDCSGLIQRSFASEDIWLPRDAYQQEKFCKQIQFNSETFDELIPGDLVFFGDPNICSHVGLYKGQKLYWHSSGEKDGRNGIGIDELQPAKENHISIFYRSKLRSIGRIEYCHDGKTLP